MHTFKVELKPTKQVAKVNPKFYLSIYIWVDRGPMYQQWHPVLHALGREEWGAIKRARKEVADILSRGDYYAGVDIALEDFILNWAQTL